MSEICSDLGFNPMRSLFEDSLGLTLSLVPRNSDKSADVLVDGDCLGYAVELKARCNPDDFEKTIESGEVVSCEDGVHFGSWAFKQAGYAERQLAAIDSSRMRLWILWFDATHRTATGAAFEQILGTVFGVRAVVDMAKSPAQSYRCLNARVGIFEKYQRIDAVVVYRGSGFAMCANELSDRFVLLRETKLFKRFAAFGGVSTVSSLQSQDGFVSVDPVGLDRDDSAAVQRHLSEKYNLAFPIMIDPISHVSSMMMPR